MNRRCDKCNTDASEARFIVDGMDLAFCGHHAQELPKSVKAQLTPITDIAPQTTQTVPVRDSLHSVDEDLVRREVSIMDAQVAALHRDLARLQPWTEHNMAPFISAGPHEPAASER